MNTSDIESDSQDVFTRKANFDELSRRFNEHRKKAGPKAMDYRYNLYLRKMNKLALTRLGGIDIPEYEAFIEKIASVSGKD